MLTCIDLLKIACFFKFITMVYLMMKSLFLKTVLLGSIPIMGFSVDMTSSNVSQKTSEQYNLKKDLILQLYQIGAVKTGEFKLKSGQISPIYFDLRVIISYPKVLQAVADSLAALAKDTGYDFICGVPYTAMPIATAISLKTSKPLVMVRKESKDHGTKKMVEGVFQSGDHCIVIEDVVTTGGSVIDTVNTLGKEGLVVEDVFVLIDRKQGGRANIENKGCKLHSVFTSVEIIETLYDAGAIDFEATERFKDYLKKNSVEL